MKIENKYYINWSILIAIILFTGSFCIGLSAGDATAETTEMDTLHKIMSSYVFQSEYDNDFQIRLIHNNGETEQIDTEVFYTNNQVKLKGLEPIKVTQLLTDKTRLEMKYRMVRMNSKIIFDTIPISDTFYIGEIPLYLTNEEIYWKITNKNGSWGVGTSFISNPKAIEDILPNSIGGIVGTNTVCLNEKGILEGTISLNAKDGQAIQLNDISLDKLNLPKMLLNEVKANGVQSSNLQIVANYEFSIPLQDDLDLDNNNKKFIKRMDNKITLQMNTIVNHK